MSSTLRIRERYDAVVVGARCAGAATALLLARGGLRVLMVDRGRYGTDTLSTHALMRSGVLQLHRWGLLERLRAADTPPIRSTTFVYGDEAIAIPIKSKDGVDALYAPRRTVLDALLVDAAREAGVDVAYGVRVSELLRAEDGRVRGAVIEERPGAGVRVEAGIVVGADGVRSTVAERVGAECSHRAPNAGGVVYAYWAGLEGEGSRWLYRPGVAAGAIPTNGGEWCVFAAMDGERFRNEVRFDLEAGYHRVIEECSPELAAGLARATRAGNYRGFPGEPGYLRRCHGPGWALVGDAGYFKDPITAHGISDALRDAELLARAILAGGEEALAGYETARDALSLGLLEVTDAIAAYDWDLATLQQLHRTLSDEMNREVDALKELGPAPAAPARALARAVSM